MIYHGFYPRVYDKNLNPTEMYSNYVGSYIERDVKQLSQINNLDLFQKFISICAGRTSQLVNLNNMSNDIGVSSKTLGEWLTILRASYIVFLLQPYHININKRTIKSSKFYFYDVGLACYLLGIHNIKQLQDHPLKGQLFENLLVLEVLKSRFNKGLTNNLTFYRDSNGNEIDLIYQVADKILPIEIKAFSSIRFDNEYGNEIFKGLKQSELVFNNLSLGKLLLYAGDNNYVLKNENIKIGNIKSLNKLLPID